MTELEELAAKLRTFWLRDFGLSSATIDGTASDGSVVLARTLFIPSEGGSVGINTIPSDTYALDIVGNTQSAGNILPRAGNAWALGGDGTPWIDIYGSTLHVGNLVAENKIATTGGRILVSPSTKLILAVTAGATTIDVANNTLSSGDRIYLEAVGKLEWMAVTSSATAVTNGYRYSVTRNLNGGGAQTWFAGDAVVNTGTTGQGFIDLYSRYGIPRSGQTSTSRPGPTITGNIRTGTTWNALRERWAVGNLNGLYDYNTTVYGFAAGDPTAAWISADATNGIRLMNSATNLGQWSATGGITIGEVAASKSNVDITSGALTIRNNTTERVKLTAAGVLTINDSGGAAVFTFDSSAGAEFTKPLTLGASGGIYQGSGTFASPTTGLKIWNPNGTGTSGGKIAGYNGGNVQWYADSDGYLKAGGIWIGSTGMTLGGDVIYWTDDGTPTGIPLSAINLPFTQPGKQIWRFDFPGNTSGTQIIQLRSDRVDAVDPLSAPGIFRSGSLQLQNSTTGVATLSPPSGSVTPTLTLPTTTGTLALTSDVTTAVSGTTGTLAKFTGANTIGDSIVSESGTVATVTGDLTFSGNARRISGEMAAASPNLANRLHFVPSNANTNGYLAVLPSGTANTGTILRAYGTSDPENSTYGQFNVNPNLGFVYVASNKNGTATTLPMTFTIGGVGAMTISVNRSVCIGRNTPIIVADTLGAANFESAGSIAASKSFVPASVSAPASPLDGEFWNDSTQKAIIGQLAGVKQALVGTIFTQTADKTVTNTTTETSIIGTGVGTVTLPANFWVAGKTIRITQFGYYTQPASSTNTRTLRIKIGSTALLSIALTISGLVITNGPQTLVTDITCRTTGGSGSLFAQGEFKYSGGAGTPSMAAMSVLGIASTAATTVDTTASAALDVTWQWGTAATSVSVTTTNTTVEVLN